MTALPTLERTRAEWSKLAGFSMDGKDARRPAGSKVGGETQGGAMRT